MRTRIYAAKDGTFEANAHALRRVLDRPERDDDQIDDVVREEAATWEPGRYRVVAGFFGAPFEGVWLFDVDVPEPLRVERGLF